MKWNGKKRHAVPMRQEDNDNILYYLFTGILKDNKAITLSLHALHKYWTLPFPCLNNSRDLKIVP